MRQRQVDREHGGAVDDDFIRQPLDEIRILDREGTARRLVNVMAPRSGAVLHRGITVGTAVDPSTELVTEQPTRSSLAAVEDQLWAVHAKYLELFEEHMLRELKRRNVDTKVVMISRFTGARFATMRRSHSISSFPVWE